MGEGEGPIIRLGLKSGLIREEAKNFDLGAEQLRRAAVHVDGGAHLDPLQVLPPLGGDIEESCSNG